jgi:hypothetical protein
MHAAILRMPQMSSKYNKMRLISIQLGCQCLARPGATDGSVAVAFVAEVSASGICVGTGESIAEL